MHEELKGRAKICLAQGYGGTNSKRWSQYPENSPAFFSSGEGCYLYTPEGERYLDFVAALGPAILGYAHPKVTEAICGAAKEGIVYSLESPKVLELGEMFKSLVPCIDVIRVFKSGSEACSAALRIARAYRQVWGVVTEGYHGWHDEFTALTPPAYGAVPTGHMEACDETWKPEWFDCTYITEPVALDDSEERKGILKERMDHAPITIFDEIVTGLRFEDLCVANHWGLFPDLICFGKALGNGMPIAIVGGDKEVMNSNQWFCSSTNSGDTCSISAALAVLDEITKKKSLKDLAYYAKRFMQNFNGLTKEIGVEIKGYGTRGMYPMATLNGALLAQELIRQHIFVGKAFYYSFAHLEAGIDEYVLNCVSDAVGKIKNGYVELVGEIPVETFKR